MRWGKNVLLAMVALGGVALSVISVSALSMRIGAGGPSGVPSESPTGVIALRPAPSPDRRPTRVAPQRPPASIGAERAQPAAASRERVPARGVPAPGPERLGSEQQSAASGDDDRSPTAPPSVVPVPAASPAPVTGVASPARSLVRAVTAQRDASGTQRLLIDVRLAAEDGSTRNVTLPVAFTPPTANRALRIDLEPGTEGNGQTVGMRVGSVETTATVATVEQAQSGDDRTLSLVVPATFAGTAAPVPAGAAAFVGEPQAYELSVAP